jgi:hypothetical protein
VPGALSISIQAARIDSYSPPSSSSPSPSPPSPAKVIKRGSAKSRKNRRTEAKRGQHEPRASRESIAFKRTSFKVAILLILIIFAIAAFGGDLVGVPATAVDRDIGVTAGGDSLDRRIRAASKSLGAQNALAGSHCSGERVRGDRVDALGLKRIRFPIPGLDPTAGFAPLPHCSRKKNTATTVRRGLKRALCEDGALTPAASPAPPVVM